MPTTKTEDISIDHQRRPQGRKDQKKKSSQNRRNKNHNQNKNKSKSKTKGAKHNRKDGRREKEEAARPASIDRDLFSRNSELVFSSNGRMELDYHESSSLSISA